jgi:hypothetical protein
MNLETRLQRLEDRLAAPDPTPYGHPAPVLSAEQIDAMIAILLECGALRDPALDPTAPPLYEQLCHRADWWAPR